MNSDPNRLVNLVALAAFFGVFFRFFSDLARLFARDALGFSDRILRILNATSPPEFFANFGAGIGLLFLLLIQKLFLLILEILDDFLQLGRIRRFAVGTFRAFGFFGFGFGSVRADSRKADEEGDCHQEAEHIVVFCFHCFYSTSAVFLGFGRVFV